MKVRCINRKGFSKITSGRVYDVKEEFFDGDGKSYYIITDNNNMEVRYNKSLFEIVKEEKVEFKIGDKVVLDIPKGKEFKEGGVGFNSGIVDKMVDIVNNTKIFTISRISCELLQFNECGHSWDMNWFKLYIEEENNMFHWNIEKSTTQASLAYLVLDISSSTDEDKKSEYIKMYNKLKLENKKVEIITHTTVAQFDIIALKASSGGTYMSSGLGLALQDMIANDYYNGFNNIKVIQMGDGDNWSEDNEKLCNLVRNLLKNGVDYQYYEVNPSTYIYGLISEKLIDNIKGIEGRIHTIKTEKKIKTTIYKIEHKVNGKLYSFISDIKLDKGDIVQCLTKDKGITYGRIMSVITKGLTKDKISEYSKCRRVI